MLLARAASINFLTLGTIAWQRGRAPQLFFIRSSTRSAVVLGSTVTDLSCGAGGALMLVHSVVTSAAFADSMASAEVMAKTVALPISSANRLMVSSLCGMVVILCIMTRIQDITRRPG